MDNLEFLDAPQGANAETQPAEPQATEPTPSEPTQAAEPSATEPVQETAEQTAARERDERGRFKRKEEAEPVMVPLRALHETRDEVKALKEQLAALQQPQQTPQTPDVFEDPQGYTAHIQNQIAQASLNERLNLSEELVRQSAGNEVVDAATEWAKPLLAANPVFAQAFYAQRNPYGFIVQQYQRHSLVTQLGDDPKQIEAFLAWRNSQGAAPQGQAPTPQPAEQPAPPRSIASATSAGGVQHQATGPGVAFGNFIK